MIDLTICSVVYFSESYANLNLELTDLRNLDYEWIIANNTDDGKPKLNNDKLSADFKVIKGMQDRSIHVPYKCQIGQMQHGLSINKCFTVKQPSRYLLVIDPDFFVYTPIRTILDYMNANELGLFGSPYLSKTPLITDFPCGFNLFIDLNRIPIESLDFTPGYGKYSMPEVNPDMGFKVYYYHKFIAKTKYEATIPYISAKESAIIRCTDKSLKSYGIKYDNTPNRKGTKMDEYFWRDEFYAIHSRGKLNQGLNYTQERVDHQLATVKRIFQELPCR